MTPLGWLIMVVSICSVVGLTAFCLYRVLALPPAEIDDLNVAPLEIETPDMRQPSERQVPKSHLRNNLRQDI